MSNFRKSETTYMQKFLQSVDQKVVHVPMMFSHSIASAWSRKAHGVVLAFEIQSTNTNYGLKRLFGPNNVSTRFVAWFPPRRWQSVQTNLFMHAFAVFTCKRMFRFLHLFLHVSSLCLLSMSPLHLLDHLFLPFSSFMSPPLLLLSHCFGRSSLIIFTHFLVL